MFCPFCGVKNDGGQAQCFVCGKKLPSLEAEAAPAQRRSRSGPHPAVVAAAAPVAARLGDRLIAVILDTLFVSSILLVSAAAVFSRWPRMIESTSFMMLIAAISVATVVVVFLYYWLLEGTFGATMGKAIVGVRVTRQDGSVPGLGSSAIRNAFRLLDALPFYLIGFFVAVFSRGRRRIGDYAARTFVLEHAAPLGERIAVVFLWLAGISAAVWGAWTLCPAWFQLPLR